MRVDLTALYSAKKPKLKDEDDLAIVEEEEEDSSNNSDEDDDDEVETKRVATKNASATAMESILRHNVEATVKQIQHATLAERERILTCMAAKPTLSRRDKIFHILVLSSVYPALGITDLGRQAASNLGLCNTLHGTFVKRVLQGDFRLTKKALFQERKNAPETTRKRLMRGKRTERAKQQQQPVRKV